MTCPAQYRILQHLLDDYFLGTTLLSVPDLDGSVLIVHIGPYAIEDIDCHNVTLVKSR